MCGVARTPGAPHVTAPGDANDHSASGQWHVDVDKIAESLDRDSAQFYRGTVATTRAFPADQVRHDYLVPVSRSARRQGRTTWHGSASERLVGFMGTALEVVEAFEPDEPRPGEHLRAGTR